MAKRVLIVDDNRPLVRMMMSALETLPYNVKVNSVPSGEEALLSVMLDKPDLMVVDLNLPGMNGLDLIQFLRDRYEDLNIVMATGQNDPTVFRRAEELGVNYRFPKPFETVAFLDAINRLLNGNELDVRDLNLPSEPPERMEDKEMPQELTFSDAVVELHKKLGAVCVAIIGENGRIIVQAGKELTSLFSEDWEVSIMSAFSAIATMQRHLPGDPLFQYQVFQTTDNNTVLTPVGRYGLVVVLPSTSNKNALNKAIENILGIQQRIATFTPPFDAQTPTDSLDPEVISEPESEPEKEEEIEVREIDIASLFSNEAVQKEADSFWNTAEKELDTQPAPRGKSGYLDFSQAQQLGLTPEEDE